MDMKMHVTEIKCCETHSFRNCSNIISWILNKEFQINNQKKKKKQGTVTIKIHNVMIFFFQELNSTKSLQVLLRKENTICHG